MVDLEAALCVEQFSHDYTSARNRLLAAFQSLPRSLLRNHQHYPHPLTGPEGEGLSCDLLQLGQREEPEQLLVLISGTHGVEGFAGSAIQCDLIARLQPLLQRHPGLGVAVIHALNPWGFAWLRRQDDAGIDLNRNFIDFSQPLPIHREFAQLRQRLQGCAAVTLQQLQQWMEGREQTDFVEVMTRGQYHHPESLFYGGQSPSWSQQILSEMTCGAPFTTARTVAVIDLHTGLGPYGYGEVINDHPPHTSGFLQTEQWYGNNALSTALGESVSGVKLGLLDYYWHQLLGDRGCFVTLEFGTYADHQLFLTLINEMLYHNRAFAQGIQRDIHSPQVQQLRHFFYPDETSWKQMVLFRGRQIVSLALTGMKPWR
ncbi:MAG: DUF2817 domain-containing protein [Gammaproteobacteria bacterium]|nr:DUF2817 domain-containing protein [Gammaproteobacteria bacterium]